MADTPFKTMVRRTMARRELTLMVLLAVLLIPISIRSPLFLAPSNVNRILNDMAILAIVAIGEFFVILSGGIDLSVGSVIAFTGMVCGMINEAHPATSPLLLLLIGLSVGAVLGLFNGVLVAYGKIPPIITTLGTVNIYRGMTFLLSGGSWVTAHELAPAYIAFPRKTFLGISYLLWIALAAIALMYYFSQHTRTGREVYAIGGNPTAAKFVGVNENKVRVIVFLVSGTLCGLAGGLWTARYASAVNEMATGFEMQAVAACVLGGVNFAGGAGGIIGVALGTLFLGVVTNALPVVYLSVFWQTFVQGLIILIALALNTISDQRKHKRMLAERRA
ncbi:MAG: ABC transporter permease [Sphaerochaeta sp.]|jgi:rhamnose transport system permease protein|nr:ABC transporter permease [Spirochaetales bacterium]